MDESSAVTIMKKVRTKFTQLLYGLLTALSRQAEMLEALTRDFVHTATRIVKVIIRYEKTPSDAGKGRHGNATQVVSVSLLGRDT